ncbi:MAG: (d)CMP kinase [Synergistaceae bacterium]|nr:(d)CMP kinase [Synergistaceae bacterium]
MQKKKNIIITIDGPAGAGKSTVTHDVAQKLGIPYLDTGAIYRSVAFICHKNGVSPNNEPALVKTLKNFKITITSDKILANNIDVTKEIRTHEMDQLVSPYAANATVRANLLDLQRSQAKNGLVADGRDMGTCVFPDADLKIFLTATAETRAKRRFLERQAKGQNPNFDEILKDVIRRDDYDMNREIAPLKPALGAWILDSSDMTQDEVTEKIVAVAKKLMQE